MPVLPLTITLGPPAAASCSAWPADRAAAAAAGALTSLAATPPAKRQRISSAVFSSPRANARVRAMRARGRSSSGASASNSPKTRSAQSAAHAATRRRSASLSVCGDPTTTLFLYRPDPPSAKSAPTTTSQHAPLGHEPQCIGGPSDQQARRRRRRELPTSPHG